MKLSKRISLAAILSALAFVILLLGGFIETLTLSVAAIASVCVAVAVYELGKSYSFIIYFCTCLLAFLLLPNKNPMLYFACFFGYYPIVKTLTECLNKWLAYFLKTVTFTAAYSLAAFIGVKFLVPETNLLKYIFIFYPAVLVVFIVFDVALTRLMNYYQNKLRKQLGIDNFFQ